MTRRQPADGYWNLLNAKVVIKGGTIVSTNGNDVQGDLSRDRPQIGGYGFAFRYRHVGGTGDQCLEQIGVTPLTGLHLRQRGGPVVAGREIPDAESAIPPGSDRCDKPGRLAPTRRLAPQRAVGREDHDGRVRRAAPARIVACPEVTSDTRSVNTISRPPIDSSGCRRAAANP